MSTTLLLSLLASIYGPEQPKLKPLNFIHFKTLEQTIEVIKDTAEDLRDSEFAIARGDLTKNVKEVILSPVVLPEITDPICDETKVDACFHYGLLDLYLEAGVEIQIPLKEYSRAAAFSHDAPNLFSKYLTPNDPTIVALAECLTAESLTREEAALEILDFVRKTEYSRDGERDNESSIRSHFPYFPKETLCRGTADCEDTSILASSLLWAVGIENVLLNLPDHEMIAIKGNFSGYHIDLGGRLFYLTETTSGGESIGRIHEDYIVQPIKVEMPLIEKKERSPFDF